MKQSFLQTIEFSKNRKKFHCDVCKRLFEFEKNLLKHKCDKNIDIKKKFDCPHCEQDFVSDLILETHVNLVHGKPFKCELCDHTFGRLDHLKIHISLRHSYPCSKCGKAFKNAKKLKKHIKIKHEETGNLMCQHCGKGFTLVTSLKRYDCFIFFLQIAIFSVWKLRYQKYKKK